MARNVSAELKIRRLLRSKKWQEASDREISKEVGCARQVVKRVRMSLIAAGKHPSVQTRKGRGENPMYQPGQAASGGWVWDENGKMVRELEWYLKQQKKRKGELPVN